MQELKEEQIDIEMIVEMIVLAALCVTLVIIGMMVVEVLIVTLVEEVLIVTALVEVLPVMLIVVLPATIDVNPSMFVVGLMLVPVLVRSLRVLRQEIAMRMLGKQEIGRKVF